MIKRIEQLNNRINKFDFRTYSLLLIVLGIGLRLYHLLLNRSLWLDEATLSNNIVSRDYLQLLNPLDYKQIAPVGFLIIQKFLISTFGVNEYALRALPALAGIFSIIIFYFLLKNIGGEKLAFTGLLFFIFGKFLIYHSTEAKQYSSDVFAYLLAFYLLYFKSIDYKSFCSVVSKGLIGAIIIWFSHCSVIFLASIGIALAVEILYYRRYNSIGGYLIMCFIWLISFGLNYFFFLFNHASREAQEISFVSAGYLPPAGTIKDGILWLLPELQKSLTYPIGITYFPFLLTLLFCTGFWYVVKYRQYRLLALALPILIHIILSFYYLYPFGGRFILYNSTFFIIYIVLGIKVIATRVKVVGIPIAGLVLFLAILNPAAHSRTPIRFEEIKSSLKYLQTHKNDNDVIYIQYNSIPAYKFYQDKFPLINSEIINGSSSNAGFDKDFEYFKNFKRVWLILTHFNDADKNYIFEKCNSSGKIVEQYEYGGAVTILYSFGDK